MVIDKDIIEKQRAALKDFMQQQKLNAFSWAKKAGVTEATIRHYLSGRSQSLTSLVLEKLAISVGVSVSDLISENKSISNNKPEDNLFNRELMARSFIDVEEFIEKSNLQLSTAEKANIVIAWYDLAKMLKQDEVDFAPEQSLMEIIRKTV